MIKCKIFTGTKFPDGDEVRFLNENVTGDSTIDEGYFDFFDKKEFELHIKKYALLMGKFVDAYDKDGKIFWSNYREIEEISALSDEDKEAKIILLKEEYLTLKGEEAKGNWGIPKLTTEIELLKQK